MAALLLDFAPGEMTMSIGRLVHEASVPVVILNAMRLLHARSLDRVAADRIRSGLDEARQRVAELAGIPVSSRHGHLPFSRRAKRGREILLDEAASLGDNFWVRSMYS